MMNEERDEQLSFARKYRPTSFSGYIGNEDTKETVKMYLKNKKRPQTILMYGNSGCGKTTLARIIEREYMCEDRDPETGACGKCMTCQLFEDYIKTGKTDMLTDVYEIDASDKSGKKDINTLLESMEYPAMGGDWKTYVIDEAHLLKEEAMGRLLKSFEEPPEGVLIILCTTNPEELLNTVRNRCQLKLPITKPKTKELMDHLQKVCLTEGKPYDLEGLRMLVGRADNVIRDSLNYLETVLATRGEATSNSVSAEFKQVNDKIIYSFFNAYYSDDYAGYADVLYKIKTGYGFDQFISSLTTFTVRGLYILNSVEVEGLTSEEIKSYYELFSRFKPQEISRILSDLRRMPLGNIEANLMAFIYCKCQNTEVSEAKVEVTQNVPITEEHKFRNNNLQLLEAKKMETSVQSLMGEMKSVSIADMANMFNLEKVNK